MLKLWLLRPRFWTDDRGYEHGLWDPWYDKCFGMVIRAENESAARQLAVNEDCYDSAWAQAAWLDSEQSSCTELTADGEEGIIISDIHSA